MNKEKFSTSEIANLLGISRIAVFKMIKSGKIKANKVGRNFVIDKKQVSFLLGNELGKSETREIDRAVFKTVNEYGEALKLLGQE